MSTVRAARLLGDRADVRRLPTQILRSRASSAPGAEGPPSCYEFGGTRQLATLASPPPDGRTVVGRRGGAGGRRSWR